MIFNLPLAYVYKITNIRTKEFYIGSRLANVQHNRTPEQDLFHFYFSSGEFKHAIKENPTEFYYEIIFRSNEQVNGEWIVYWYEQLTILENWNNPLLKNKTYRKFDGKAFYRYGPVDEDTRKKIINGLIGRQVSDTTKQKISLALKGKSFSEERCKNISNAITGRKIKNTQNMNKDKIGIPLSESHKNKISDSKKGIPLTEEHRIKLSEAHKGKPLPQSTIDKKCKPCTVDGVKIYPSLKALIKELGKGKNGARSENLRYV